MIKLGSDLQVGDVFEVNGARYELLTIESHPEAKGRKMRFKNQSTGREYVRLVYDTDQLRVIA